MFNFFKSKKIKESSLLYKNLLNFAYLEVKLNSDGVIREVNNNFCKELSVSAFIVEGKNFVSFLSSSKEFLSNNNKFKEALKSKADYKGEIQIVISKNRFELIASFMRTQNDILLSLVNLTSYHEDRKNYYREFYFDTLTGFANRNQLLDNLNQSHKATLIVFDIDNFKYINNFYGYEIGDKLLKAVSIWLEKSKLSQNTIFYKLPVDRFAMQINEELAKARLIHYLNAFTKAISKKRFNIENNEINVTFTIGASQNTTRPLKYANSALSQAKEQMKNFLIYDEEVNQDLIIAQNLKMTRVIKNAIKGNLVLPYYQKILKLDTESIEKYETLMRIRDLSGKTYIPDEFLDIARKSKLYPNLVYKMLNIAFIHYRSYDFKFSINFFAEDFLNSQIMDFVLKMIRDSGLGYKIIIEILESEHIKDYDEVSLVLDQFRDLGCEIAVDDFGKGYSNVEHLLKLKLDYIKIDGSIVQNIDVHETSAVIVKTIANFAKEVKIKTIAEYTHNATVFKKVKEYGIDYAQGNFISPAGPKLQ